MRIKFKKHGVLVTIGIVIVVFVFIFNRKTEEKVESIPVLPTVAAEQEATLEVVEETDSTDVTIIVDIKGEVKKPGVYQVEADDRVNDVVLLAGGFTEEANVNSVNLAQRVHDEMAIIVPNQNDEDVHHATGEVISGSVEVETGAININTATSTEIEQLPGIGPAKAQAIIDYREEHGLFTDIEDLLNISGIGEKTLDNMRDQIQVR